MTAASRILITLAGLLVSSGLALAADDGTCDGIPPPCIPAPVAPRPNANGQAAAWVPSDDGPSGVTRVSTNAQLLYDKSRFTDLDNLIDRYSKLTDRFYDGRFKLIAIDDFFNQAFATPSGDGISLPDQLRKWHEINPRSPGEAIAETAYWMSSAWRARGNGFANTVSPEGWRLFKQRMRRAEQSLETSQSYAATTPVWYDDYLYVSLGLDKPIVERLKIYQRGIKAFPAYYPLHFGMLNSLLPKWGGSNEAVAAFIDAVAKRSSMPERDQLYTRLWWYVDENNGLDVNIFRDMGASWPRMKKGFESLHEAFPNSRWNQSNFASLACRAGDFITYKRLRAELGTRIYVQAFPSNASLDVCDAQAAQPSQRQHSAPRRQKPVESEPHPVVTPTSLWIH